MEPKGQVSYLEPLTSTISKYLITGGAGFIGSNLIRSLLEDDSNRVLNLDKLTYAGNLQSLADVASNPAYTFAQAWHDTYGLPVLVTNCSNNYGPYQFPEKLIPVVILKCLAGEPIPVYGQGENIRDWLYVEDHCQALQRVMQQGTPGETYNIAATTS